MKLTTVRPGVRLCVPHSQGLEPRFFYEGCTNCEKSQTEGADRRSPPSPAQRAGKLASLGEIASSRASKTTNQAD